MASEPNARPTLDDDTLAFAARVFQYARMGHADELAELFGQGLPANLRNDKGDSLLMLAAYNGQADAARVILEAGGDPELANDRGQTPLAGAAFKNDLAIARLLLQHGAAVDGTGDGTRTALMTAAMFDRTEMVDLLLQHGADPDRRDASGQSAADMARAMGAQATPASSTGRSGRRGEGRDGLSWDPEPGGRANLSRPRSLSARDHDTLCLRQKFGLRMRCGPSRPVASSFAMAVLACATAVRASARVARCLES